MPTFSRPTVFVRARRRRLGACKSETLREREADTPSVSRHRHRNGSTTETERRSESEGGEIRDVRPAESSSSQRMAVRHSRRQTAAGWNQTQTSLTVLRRCRFSCHPFVGLLMKRCSVIKIHKQGHITKLACRLRNRPCYSQEQISGADHSSS